ncbi:MAG: alpha/beta hydrolase family protein, partial [Hyphococcus sp.]
KVRRGGARKISEGHMLRRARIMHVFISFVFAAAAPGVAQAQMADPALFGALPEIEQVKMSPDGETVAVLRNQDGASSVIFVDIDDPAAQPRGVGIGAAKARSIEWVGNDYVLLLTSFTGNASTITGMQLIEFFRWLAISVEDRKTKVLFQRDAGFYVSDAGSLMATLPDKPQQAVMARWTPNARASSAVSASRIAARVATEGYSLFNVNMKSGRDRITAAGNPETVDWVVNADGEAIMRIDYLENLGERRIFSKPEGSRSFELVKTIPEERADDASILFHGMAPNPEEVLATVILEGTSALVAIDRETGEISRKVFHDASYDVGSIVYDPLSAEVSGVQYTDDIPKLRHLDQTRQALQENLARALPGSTPMITSFSVDGSKMVVRALYPDRPDDIYTFDKNTRNLALFSSTSPAIADRVYGEKTKYNYVSPDGLMINGYLTTPAGAEKSQLPLIVLPHGGPATRDSLSFDWWAFFYAARGYAVYQPNFRGSSGYGVSFRRAGDGEWGRKMQDDITNGVNKLVADGIADPDRICIVGGSYGGYAALAGATLTPDLYACAVSVNGVSDLPRMIGEAAQRSSISAEQWERRIGSRFRDADELAAVSPARRAASAGAPIMLIHGKDDTVVPFYQSEIMRDALTIANKPHEFVELAGEDHWLSSGESRTEMLRASIEFIDRHIGGE